MMGGQAVRIAVTSKDLKSVTSHAGRERNFLIFDVLAGEPPRLIEPRSIHPDLTIGAWNLRGPHPLDDVDVIITKSHKEHFPRRVGSRGILAVICQSSDPVEAIADFLASEGALERVAKTKALKSPEVAESRVGFSRQNRKIGCPGRVRGQAS